MNLSSISVSARLVASVTPNDPTASGNFSLGLQSVGDSNTSLNAPDQLYAVSLTEVDDLSLALLTGVATVNGGSYAGGDGKDADGVTVALTEVAAILVRNTGTNAIVLDVPTLDGDVDVVDGLVIQPKGEFFVQSQAAASDGTLTLDSVSGSDPISADVVILGKL